MYRNWQSPGSDVPQFSLATRTLLILRRTLPTNCTNAAAADFDNSGACDLLLTSFNDTRLYRNTTTNPEVDPVHRRHRDAPGAGLRPLVSEGPVRGLGRLQPGRLGRSLHRPRRKRRPSDRAPHPDEYSTSESVRPGLHLGDRRSGRRGGLLRGKLARHQRRRLAGPSDRRCRRRLAGLVLDETQYRCDLDSYAFVESAASFFPAFGNLPSNIADFAWVDFDGDGDTDLVLACIGGSTSLRFYAKQGTVFQEVSAASLQLHTPLDGPFVGLEVLDVDLNGYPDLIVSPSGGSPRLLAGGLAGPGTLTDLTAMVPADWGLGSVTVDGGLIACDFSRNDGDLDVYLGRHGAPTNAFFYQCRWGSADAPPTGSPWIEVALEGTANNLSAMGATVSWQGKTQVYGGHGQSPLPLVFAAGGSSRDLQITWPNGHVESVTLPNNGIQSDITEVSPYLTSIKGTYQPQQGGATYKFTWDVKNCFTLVEPTTADAAVQFLKVYSGGNPCYCGEGETLTHTDQGVAVDLECIDPNQGWYRYTLSWEDGCCVVVPGGCRYDFRVETDLGNLGLLRSTRQTMPPIQTCFQILGP